MPAFSWKYDRFAMPKYCISTWFIWHDMRANPQVHLWHHPPSCVAWHVSDGFGGQKFIMSQLDKIRAARSRITASGREIALEIDGGVNAETALLCREAGADVLVALGAPREADVNGVLVALGAPGDLAPAPERPRRPRTWCEMMKRKMR